MGHEHLISFASGGVALLHEADEATDDIHRHVDISKKLDGADLGDVGVGEDAHAVGAAADEGEQSPLVVEPKCSGGDAGDFCDIFDGIEMFSHKKPSFIYFRGDAARRLW